MTPSTDSGYAGLGSSLSTRRAARWAYGEVDSELGRTISHSTSATSPAGTLRLDADRDGDSLHRFTSRPTTMRSSTKTWSSNTTTGGGVALAHADLNNDGIADVVGITSGGLYLRLRRRTPELLWSHGGVDFPDTPTAPLAGSRAMTRVPRTRCRSEGVMNISCRWRWPTRAPALRHRSPSSCAGVGPAPQHRRSGPSRSHYQESRGHCCSNQSPHQLGLAVAFTSPTPMALTPSPCELSCAMMFAVFEVGSYR